MGVRSVHTVEESLYWPTARVHGWDTLQEKEVVGEVGAKILTLVGAEQ